MIVGNALQVFMEAAGRGVSMAVEAILNATSLARFLQLRDVAIRILGNKAPKHKTFSL
jgi:hypothetical protein